MRHSFALAALAALVKAQDATPSLTASVFSIETTIPENPPDALDFAGIDAIPEPTYTEIPGLSSQVISYATATAISGAAASVSQDPLSVFPAATDVPMNSNGESDDSVQKRDLVRRNACDPQATIPNYYNVDLSSYDNFKADQSIASVANAAPTPAGYWQNFKNQPGANSAYAYLGYTQVKTYDVNSCANTCTQMSGCIAFNIYFERDPIVEPGFNGQCENPLPFANIKCSFWGSILDQSTANNYGQWRSGFQVAVAGSNAYTSYSVGGPIDGCVNPPLSLDKSVMNAPLRDCQGTWTYMGYKLLTAGPYDPTLCKAACDAQSKYNLAHPPSDGSKAPVCSAFGSYILTKTNSTGSFVQGQMCTLYTSAWDKKYAVNTAAYNDAKGEKYTYSLSYFYSLTTQPTCPSTSDCNQPFECGSGTGILTCGTSSQSLYCFENTSGGGYWAANQYCSQLKQCSTDSDCGSGEFCSVKTCCGNPVCIPHSICPNSVSPSRLFRFKPRQEEVEKRDDGCVPSALQSCS